MENRSTTCKTQSSNQTANRTANSRATNEHKHPNQYTKGADDEGAKNAKNSTRSSSKNCR